MTASPRALSLAPVLRSTIDTSSEQFQQNRAAVLEQPCPMARWCTASAEEAERELDRLTKRRSARR